MAITAILYARGSVRWVLVGVWLGMGSAAAQAPPKAPSPATVNQIMRGILFINSNIVFSAQTDDPAAATSDGQGSRGVNALTGLYGGWEAIENAGLAIAESAVLLDLQRPCSNGKPAPVNAPDWKRFVEEMRQAGLAAFKAGQAKDLDAMLGISDRMSTACANCHRVYRNPTGPAIRCAK